MTDTFRALCAELIASWDADGCDWKPHHQSRWEATVARARAVLARWGNHVPAPPADGEVAELAAWLREQLHVCLQAPWTPGIKHFGRAAELLQRQVLVQVPAAERPWEREGWCDELGRCWWGRPDTGGWSADWTLATPEAVAEFCEFSPQTVCLPAHALPLPEVGA